MVRYTQEPPLFATHTENKTWFSVSPEIAPFLAGIEDVDAEDEATFSAWPRGITRVVALLRARGWHDAANSVLVQAFPNAYFNRWCAVCGRGIDEGDYCEGHAGA